MLQHILILLVSDLVVDQAAHVVYDYSYSTAIEPSRQGQQVAACALAFPQEVPQVEWWLVSGMRELVFFDELTNILGLLCAGGVGLHVGADVLVDLYSRDGRDSIRRLEEGFVGESECSNVRNVDDYGCHHDFLKRVQIGQTFHHSVLCENAPSIEVYPIASAALHVRVYVASPMALRQLFDHLYFSCQLASLHVWCRGIDNNLGSVHYSIDHRIVRNPSLLADFVA